MIEINGLLAALTTGNALGPILAQVVGPITANLVPSKLALDNLELRKQEVSLRKEESQMREQHFVKLMKATRENIILNLETARRNQEDQVLFNQWPLRVSAISILRVAEQRNWLALNIIPCIVDTNVGKSSPEHGPAIDHTIEMIRNNTLRIAEKAVDAFGKEMLYYPNTLRSSELTGDTLRTTLSALLASEPTILIEIRVPHPDRITLHVCHWGLPSERRFNCPVHNIQPRLASA